VLVVVKLSMPRSRVSPSCTYYLVLLLNDTQMRDSDELINSSVDMRSTSDSVRKEEKRLFYQTEEVELI
jgi:hypothetical protein